VDFWVYGVSLRWEVKTPALSQRTRQGQGTQGRIKLAKGWASPRGSSARLMPLTRAISSRGNTVAVS
jgi:hypothetical protein